MDIHRWIYGYLMDILTSIAVVIAFATHVSVSAILSYVAASSVALVVRGYWVSLDFAR